LEKVLLDVSIAFHHRVMSVLVNSLELKSSSTGLEKDLWALESFVSHNNGSSVWQVVVLIIVVVVLRFLQLLVEVLVHNVTEFLLDVSYNLKFSRGREVVASILEQLSEVLGDVFA
jgi:hypothetical protein